MKKLLFFLIFVFLSLALATAVSATNCDSCANCTAELNKAGANTIYLNTDITSSGTCINAPANFDNKIFDCQGHTMTGITTGFGIYLANADNVTITNCTVSNFSDDIGLRYATNSLVEYSTFLNAAHESMSIDYSHYNVITHNEFTTAVQQGIEILNSSYNNITYNTMTNCSEGIDFHWQLGDSTFNNVWYNTMTGGQSGISIWSTDKGVAHHSNNISHNKIYNVTFTEGLSSLDLSWHARAIFIEGSIHQECDNYFSNNTYNDVPIYFYNDTVNLSNINTAQIFLCGADNSVLDNVTVDGLERNAVSVYFSDNVTIKNSNFTNLLVGVELLQSTNVVIQDTFLKNTTEYSINLGHGTYRYNSISHCSINVTNVTGDNDNPVYFFNSTSLTKSISDMSVSELVLCGTNDFNVTNVTFDNTNSNGIFLQNAERTTIKDSTFNKCFNGIIFQRVGYNNNTVIYNNVINDSVYNGIQMSYLSGNLNITNNVISNNNYAGIVDFAYTTYEDYDLVNNSIFGNAYFGFLGYLDGDAIVDSNDIYDNKLCGFGNYYSDGFTFQNNIVHNNGNNFVDNLEVIYTGLMYCGFGSILEYLGNSPHLINNTFYDNNNTIKINASSKTYFEDNTIINGTGKCIEIISTDILFNGTNDFSGCSGSAFSGGNSIVNDNLIISG